MRSTALALVAAAILAGCGEPDVSVEISNERSGHVLDLANLFGEHREGTPHDELDDKLTQIAQSGPDIVALTYETDQASCGEAYRAAREFVQAWDADIAIVAVAQPGDFASTEEPRERCVGVQPRNDRAVPGGLREQIAEELIPPKAADNDWYGVFTTAADALAQS